MRNKSHEPGGSRPYREITGVLISTAVHAGVLIALSFFFLDDSTTTRIETTSAFADHFPAGVMTLLDEEPLAPEQPRDIVVSEATTVGAGDLQPLTAESLLPRGLMDDNNDAANPSGGNSEELAGVAAAVAEIQKRVTKAGGKTGEIQFSLSWQDKNDLDLHVIVPQGMRIHFRHRKSKCGGELDVDMNVQPDSDEPVENVRWRKGKGQSGRYTVLVNLFRLHERTRGIPFELVAKRGGTTELVEGIAGRGGNLQAFRFIYIRPTVGAKRRVQLEAHYKRLQEKEEAIASRLLAEATANQKKDLEKISIVAFKYPHTNASLKALQLLPGEIAK